VGLRNGQFQTKDSICKFVPPFKFYYSNFFFSVLHDAPGVKSLDCHPLHFPAVTLTPWARDIQRVPPFLFLILWLFGLHCFLSYVFFPFQYTHAFAMHLSNASTIFFSPFLLFTPFYNPSHFFFPFQHLILVDSFSDALRLLTLSALALRLLKNSPF